MPLHIKPWMTQHIQHQSGMVHPLKKHLKWQWLRFSAFTKGFNLVLQGGAHFFSWGEP